MKKLIILSAMVGITLVVIGIIGLFPFHFYLDVINEGIDNERLQLERLDDFYFNTKVLEAEDFKMDYQGNPHLWKNFHLKSFMVPLPYDQPVYTFIPHILRFAGKLELGYHIEDKQKKLLFKVDLARKSQLNLTTHGQWLFKLPIFKNYILSRPQDEIWKDLFSRKIIRYSNNCGLCLSESDKLARIGLKEMAYNLYLLYLRKNLFGPEVKGFAFYPQKNVGVIKKNTVDDYLQEELLFLQKGQLNHVAMSTYTNLYEGEFMRKLFFERVALKASSKDMAIAPYARHRHLDYEDKFNQRGLLYMFSAYTQDMENPELLKEMIRFLERGRPDFDQIKPLYDFAYAKFGTNYSELEKYRQENTQQLLKRKSIEEQEQEKKSVEVIPEDSYQSQQEKVLDYLKRAKSKKSRDGKLNVLEVQ